MLVYAFLGVKHDRMQRVVSQIRMLDENIKRVHLAYGEYDLIAELEARSPVHSLKMLNEIKNLDGVVSLKTYVASHDIMEGKVMLNSKIYA